MNREELEKMINNEDLILWNWQSLKQFIFDTIIPEVLKSVLLDENKEYMKEYFNAYYIEARENIKFDIKTKAKEQFNIDL